MVRNILLTGLKPLQELAGTGLPLLQATQITTLSWLGHLINHAISGGLSHYNSKSFHDQVLVKQDSAGSVLWTNHFSSKTTEIYTHVSRTSILSINSPLEDMDF